MSGEREWRAIPLCPECNGTGMVTETSRWLSGEGRPCHACGQSGMAEHDAVTEPGAAVCTLCGHWESNGIHT